MSIGLGGGGAVFIAHETTVGTYLDTSTVGGVWVPILSESFRYNEDRYYSPQLRQQVMVSDVKQGYYHIEGDITMEVDTNFLPYFLHCSRHTITKTGTGPYTYKYVPNKTASIVPGSGARTASITIVRNGLGFGYAGCVVTGYEFTIEDAVLRVTLNMIGLSDQDDPVAIGTPTWTSPDLLGADAHAIFVAAAGTTPTFGAASTNFNGFTFRANHNGNAQNRIRKDRSASYVSMGETEASYETELDFEDKTEYVNFKNTTQKAIKLESTQGVGDFTAATDGVKIQANRSNYDTYEVDLPGMGDIIMARVTGRVIGIAGGDAYEIHVKSAANLT